MPKSLLAAFAFASALALSGVALHAGTTPILYDSGDVAGSPTGVTLTTPNTYASCVDAWTTDKVRTDGVGLDRRLKGAVIVQYVTDDGRALVHLYPVDQAGDLDLTVQYPPVSQWPVQANGTREIHVDVQLELYENGFKVATLGPGNDWDLYCLFGPPPPPPSFEGCTPGYWKNTRHYDSWPSPYVPQTTFFSVFGVGSTKTLAQALKSNGDGNGEGQMIFHATAALLNAASSDVDYTYTVASVKQLVQQAYATNNFEAIKNLFEAANEIGCPLN